MADHKGLPVSGYVPQTSDNIDLVNANKRMEERVLRQIEAIQEISRSPHIAVEYDMRWISVARTHIEQGFMALNRAIFRPGRVSLPEDGVTKE